MLEEEREEEICCIFIASLFPFGGSLSSLDGLLWALLCV